MNFEELNFINIFFVPLYAQKFQVIEGRIFVVNTGCKSSFQTYSNLLGYIYKLKESITLIPLKISHLKIVVCPVLSSNQFNFFNVFSILSTFLASFGWFLYINLARILQDDVNFARSCKKILQEYA